MKNRPLTLTVAGDDSRERALTAINNLLQAISRRGYRVEINEVVGKWVVDRFLLKSVSINLFDKAGELTRLRFALDMMVLKNSIGVPYGFFDNGGQYWGTAEEILRNLEGE